MVRCNQEQRGYTSTRTTGTKSASTQQNWQYSNSESDMLHGHAVVVHIVCTQYCVYWQDANTTVCIATRVVTRANPAFKPQRTHHHTIHHSNNLQQPFPALSSRIRKAENRVRRVLLNSPSYSAPVFLCCTVCMQQDCCITLSFIDSTHVPVSYAQKICVYSGARAYPILLPPLRCRPTPYFSFSQYAQVTLLWK